jgi:hypothetical protein
MTPDDRWDRISVHFRGAACDYAHILNRVKDAESRQTAAGVQVRSQSHHALSPSPVVTDSGTTRMPGVHRPAVLRELFQLDVHIGQQVDLVE